MTKKTNDKIDQKSFERAAARVGQQEKFKWIKAVGADKSLNASTRIIAVMTAFYYAGTNGHFRVTRQAISKISGESISTIKRAITELVKQNYLDVEYKSARANHYIIIPIRERLEMWNAAEADWSENCHKWQFAKNKWESDCQKWLEAEKKIQNAAAALESWNEVFNAGLPHRHETTLVGRAWNLFRQRKFTSVEDLQAWISEELHKESAQAEALLAPSGSDHLRPSNGPPVDRYRAARDPLAGRLWTPSGLPGHPHRVTPHPLTSENGQTPLCGHKGSEQEPHKGFLKEPEQHSHAPRAGLTPALLAARSNSAAATADPRPPTPRLVWAERNCPMCGVDGIMIDPENYPLELSGEFLVHGEYETLHVECKHSLAANIAEIRRLESETGGRLGLGKTCWRELDELWGYDNDGEDYSLVTGRPCH